MKRITFFMLLFAVQQSQAQFNDSTHHMLAYSATGIINKTNNNRSYLLNNEVRYTLNSTKITLNAAAGYVYGQLQDMKTNNDFSSTVDCDLFKTSHRLYYWALGSYDKSYSLKINDRLQAGGGVAYNFIRKANALLVLS